LPTKPFDDTAQAMAATDPIFNSQEQHRRWLADQSAMPQGFSTGTHRFAFTPREVDKPSQMTITVIAVDQPTTAFAGLFTKNALPGAPVILGRARLLEPSLGAIIINNKISNVCAPDGLIAAEQMCAAAAAQLGITARQVIPCSTGVIGWQLPIADMIGAIPHACSGMRRDSLLAAAEGIMTTDLFPKVRRRTLAGGSIVGIAKGAGMIEPDMATMLVYILTDLSIPRQALRESLSRACDVSFNCMSIDSDTSTSDTLLALSSQRIPCSDLVGFSSALNELCSELSEDVARNGEGVHHVMRVTVLGAPSRAVGRALGKAVVNSPLFQCAVCGNDPNVGRLVMAIGKEIGSHHPGVSLSRLRIQMGGLEIFRDGSFHLDRVTEDALIAHLKAAELYQSAPPTDGVYTPPIGYPPHAKRVEITIDLGSGDAATTTSIIGTDRSHEYISENADYRS
jgi:glutamate N-acetyltransferase/amino-acid N-acetyltransferase